MVLLPGGIRAYAASAGALPLDPAPTRRAPGLCPWTPRLRGGRRGSAPGPRAYAAGAQGTCPLGIPSSAAAGTGETLLRQLGFIQRL
ncbi:hypothetical protein D7X33_00225 [Butyricicoccus sp. 1XD8-22]|nr:hypothetical protein D7X33_00225 [Butyricicoccus sp. 1XD8-22]